MFIVPPMNQVARGRGAVPPDGGLTGRGAGLEFVLHAVERRDPGRDEVGDVAGAEELLAADEDVPVVLVPAHPGTGAERLGGHDLPLPQRYVRTPPVRGLRGQH
jgi:hypothetical protein